MLPYLYYDRFNYLFYFDSETIAALAACALRVTTKKVVNFFEEKSASGDLV